MSFEGRLFICIYHDLGLSQSFGLPGRVYWKGRSIRSIWYKNKAWSLVLEFFFLPVAFSTSFMCSLSSFLQTQKQKCILGHLCQEGWWWITQGAWIWNVLPLDGNCEPVQVRVEFLLLISLYKPEHTWEVQYLPSGEKKARGTSQLLWRLECCSTPVYCVCSIPEVLSQVVFNTQVSSQHFRATECD